MIRVSAPSRLHFGLLHLPEPLAAAGTRRFGGVGLMIERPGVHLTATPARDWTAEGVGAERVLDVARRFARETPAQSVRPQHFRIEQTAAMHVGLGTGTQLALATGLALTRSWEIPKLDGAELARRTGRGLRSGIGVHGFFQGGFLVDGGKRAPEGLAPLLVRVAFPEAWRIVLTFPPGEPGRHGAAEVRAFERLTPSTRDPGHTDALCRLVLLGMLPALHEVDLPAFGEALHEFNRRVGEAFAPVQGGVYASDAVAEVVKFVRGEGIRGVGQSSWGPAVFAVTADPDRAEELAGSLRRRFALDEGRVRVTRARNQGTA